MSSAHDKSDAFLSKDMPLDKSDKIRICAACNKKQEYIGEGSLYRGKTWICGFKCHCILANRDRAD